MKLNLQTTQELFWRLTQAPDGVARAWEGLRRSPAFNFRETGELWVESKPGEALERLEIYAQMYFWRIFESIQEDFPATESCIGKKDFHRLIVDYLKDHPSRYRDIAQVGGHLPNFVEKAVKNAGGDWKFLPDLARWEWAQVEVNREADVVPLAKEDLEKIPVNQWGPLVFTLIPAARLLKSRWNIFIPWKQVVLEKKDVRGFKPDQKNTHLLVWRKGFNRMILEIDAEEMSLLRKMQKGIEFQGICEFLAERDPETAAAKAGQYLHQWIHNELLIKK